MVNGGGIRLLETPYLTICPYKCKVKTQKPPSFFFDIVIFEKSMRLTNILHTLQEGCFAWVGVKIVWFTEQCYFYYLAI